MDGICISGGMFDARRPGHPGPRLHPADDVRGGGPDGPVVVISHALWQRRFGGAADAIGRGLDSTASVHDRRRQPAGVLRPRGRPGADVVLPIGTEPLLAGCASRARQRSNCSSSCPAAPRQSVEQGLRASARFQPEIMAATCRPTGPLRNLPERAVYAGAGRNGRSLRQRYTSRWSRSSSSSGSCC